MDPFRERLVLCARRVLGDAHEAEDVVQETLIKAPPGATEGWLYATTYRGAIDKLRARGRRARAVVELSRQTQAKDETPFDLEAVRTQLARLDEPYRSAVSLRYLDDLDFPEVARRLGTIERTARTWVGRGLQKLRDALGAEP